MPSQRVTALSLAALMNRGVGISTQTFMLHNSYLE